MHDLTSSFSLGVAASLGIAAVTTLWLSPCRADELGAPAPQLALADRDRPPANLTELRAQGPAGLDALSARFAAQHGGAMDPAWEAAFDTVAGQRYAAWSRLYWFTDLDRAKQEARHRHRPILALRMLGDLREDLSCANSRLFRATLYANTEVSAYLREHFVLYWSSERTVPVVTIDFGDGKKLVRTTTGNSAHYVLDDNGNVLDVLPGLYAPSVFRAELAKSVALADRVRGKPEAERVRETLAYHTAALAASERAWQRAAGVTYLAGTPYLHGPTALARAQRATMSKMIVEAPDLRAIGAIRPGELPADDGAAWSAIGQKLWDIHERPAPRGSAAAIPGTPASIVLDAASRDLVQQLHDAAGQRATPGDLAVVIARLEQHIVADTAINELVLRRAIRRQIIEQRETGFAALNRWIYDTVFATPSSDPWLGLLPRTDFTGLPGDGVVMP